LRTVTGHGLVAGLRTVTGLLRVLGLLRLRLRRLLRRHQTRQDLLELRGDGWDLQAARARLRRLLRLLLAGLRLVRVLLAR
jgi:hypothetical protein